MMVSDLRTDAVAQEQLIAYLKHHRIGHAEDILWQLLGVLATAADNPEKSLPFYQEIIEFLQHQAIREMGHGH